MRSVCAALGALTVLVACSDPVRPSSALDPAALPVAAAQGASGNGAVMTRAPFHTVLFSRCTGETIIFDGTLRILTHVRTDGSGGAHSTMNSALEDANATAPSGARYKVVMLSHQNANEGIESATEQTTVDVFRVITRGGAPNWLITAVIHVTINANGEPTATVTHVSDKCTG